MGAFPKNDRNLHKESIATSQGRIARDCRSDVRAKKASRGRVPPVHVFRGPACKMSPAIPSRRSGASPFWVKVAPLAAEASANYPHHVAAGISRFVMHAILRVNVMWLDSGPSIPRSANSETRDTPVIDHVWFMEIKWLYAWSDSTFCVDRISK